MKSPAEAAGKMRGGVKLSLNSKVATEVFIFEKGNVDKPLREREQGHCDQNSGSGIGYARGRY